MGSRFIVALLGSCLITLLLLLGVGYSATQLTIRSPRDPFRTGSFEFDLAPGWWCEQDGTEFVCNPAGKPPHAAIAIVAIKERNDKDNLAAYEEHLRQPQRPRPDAPVSEVRYVRRQTLRSKEWVESLHIGSELQGYHTYYLGTATSHLGILVTMTVKADQEAAYVHDIREMMGSLVLYQR